MRSERREGLPVDPSQRYLALLQEYAATARKLFPESEPALENSSFSTSDALFLGYFLECLPQKVVVLELGYSTGASALWFAGHPQVSRVESLVFPNSHVEAPDTTRAVIQEHSVERKKVHFHESSLESLAETMREIDLPESGDGLVVCVGGPHNRESVAGRLGAALDFSPEVTVLLNGCRHERGLFVQAGVIDFLGRTGDRYHFRLAGDLGTALSGSGIGVLYPDAGAAGIERALDEVGRAFSRKLDPLRLLNREEELMNIVSKLNRQLTQANEQRARLQRQVFRLKKRAPELEAKLEEQRARNTALLTHYSSRRYKIADALFDRLRRLPGATRLLRKFTRSGSS